MRGVYKASKQFTNVTTAFTLLQFVPTATIALEIISATITNINNTTNQQMESFFQRITTAGITATGTVTPSKMEPGDQAAASTVSYGTWGTEPVYTANTQIGLMGWASLAGYQFAPVPEERPIVPPAAVGLGLKLNTTGTSTTYDVETTFREIA